MLENIVADVRGADAGMLPAIIIAEPAQVTTVRFADSFGKITDWYREGYGFLRQLHNDKEIFFVDDNMTNIDKISKHKLDTTGGLRDYWAVFKKMYHKDDGVFEAFGMQLLIGEGAIDLPDSYVNRVLDFGYVRFGKDLRLPYIVDKKIFPGDLVDYRIRVEESGPCAVISSSKCKRMIN
ncbi:MAG: hypothetical protein ABIA62_00405 [Candidatus Woesearchaeota archaeon]